MPNLMTYSQACSRFSNLASTGISITEAISEAVERIYEMGRFYGTTSEILLEQSDFEFDQDLNCYFVYFDEETYNGAIGFRSDSRGFGIVDNAVLYRDGINAGDFEFVDYGTVDVASIIDPATSGMAVTGTLSPDATETYAIQDGTVNGRPFYTFGSIVMQTEVGAIFIPGDANASGVIAWDGELWKIDYYIAGSDAVEDVKTWFSSEDVATPDLVASWSAGAGATGTPSVDEVEIPAVTETVQKRKYRTPICFDVQNGPYYALMKLEAPQLSANTLIQIPVGPLKCAVLAVCQEYVGDDERALLNWQKFDNFITRSERQTHGPKKMFMSFDSSLRRKPTQFM